MTKRITFNGIEMSLTQYDTSAVGLLDYLEKATGRLEKELDNIDGFNLSINVDFSPNKPPKPHITSNGSTSRQIKEKVINILERTTNVENNRVSGSMKVNLLMQDS